VVGWKSENDQTDFFTVQLENNPLLTEAEQVFFSANKQTIGYWN
jgi:hypothetical protein